MKRLTYIIVVILFSYSAHAGRLGQVAPEIKHGQEHYKLAMSKNDKLCRHMLQLFNDDLKKYGHEKYDEHEEFRKIPWQEARFSVERQDRTDYMPVQGALFDFNNDGVVDFVVKWVGSLGGRQADSLHMLGSEAAKRADELVNKELFASKNKINLSGSFYSLQPPYKVIGGVRILDPFIYDGVAYLYMRSLFDARLAIGEREYAVIARYHGGTFYDRDVSGKMDDVCYFEHVRKTHRPKN